VKPLSTYPALMPFTVSYRTAKKRIERRLDIDANSARHAADQARRLGAKHGWRQITVERRA
jgi:hypothetical protein